MDESTKHLKHRRLLFPADSQLVFLHIVLLMALQIGTRFSVFLEGMDKQPVLLIWKSYCPLIGTIIDLTLHYNTIQKDLTTQQLDHRCNYFLLSFVLMIVR